MLAYWAAGLYPYKPAPYFNDLSYIPAQSLNFRGPGIAYGLEQPPWLKSAIAATSLRIVLEAAPASRPKQRWARIVSLSGKAYQVNFSIVQDGSDLVVQVRGPDTDASGKPGHVFDDFFARPGWHRIELSIKPGLLSVALDGRETLRKTLIPAPLSGWSSDYLLVFGNELGFGRPWIGEIRRADIIVDGQTYDYLSPGALERPEWYHLPLAYRYIQWVPFSTIRLGQAVILDYAVNLLGFVPFGFFLGKTLGKRVTLPALGIMCCTMSLSIEVAQIWIATRSPSMDDLVLNTIGGALGAWAGMRTMLPAKPS